jgi:hypothetical protein
MRSSLPEDARRIYDRLTPSAQTYYDWLLSLDFELGLACLYAE